MSKPNPAAAKPELPISIIALNATLRVMERRLRLYRNLVICVSLTLFGSLILALVLRNWIVLAGVLAVPLYVGGFLYLDARAVREWRGEVLTMHQERKLDLADLKRTLTAMRYIPEATLQSMFSTLDLG